MRLPGKNREWRGLAFSDFHRDQYFRRLAENIWIGFGWSQYRRRFFICIGKHLQVWKYVGCWPARCMVHCAVPCLWTCILFNFCFTCSLSLRMRLINSSTKSLISISIKRRSLCFVHYIHGRFVVFVIIIIVISITGIIIIACEIVWTPKQLSKIKFCLSDFLDEVKKENLKWRQRPTFRFC